MHLIIGLAEAIEADRHREQRRLAHLHALREGQARHSIWAEVRTRVLRAIGPERPLKHYPCRLPDGSRGRLALVAVDGEWALACRAE
jgi:hypothetical protein